MDIDEPETGPADLSKLNNVEENAVKKIVWKIGYQRQCDWYLCICLKNSIQQW